MSLAYGLLGLLSYGPMTGYDLKRLFADSVDFFWSAQTSQIYRELKVWEDDGSIVCRVEPGDRGPDKRVYTITDRGVSRLHGWLAEVPDDLQEDNRNAFLLRVFLLPHLGIDDMIAQIRKRLDKYKSDLEGLKVVEARMSLYALKLGRPDAVHYWKVVLNRGFHDVSSHIAWAEESLVYLEKLKEEKKS